MIINDENRNWAMEKLMRFAGWRGFPTNSDDLEGRIRSFLRLVHNKPVREVIKDSCYKKGLPIPEINWEAKGMDPTQLDTDWILDVIADNLDYFPLPVQMRELYTAKLPAASTFSEVSAREE